MGLQSLDICNFRNIETASLAFSPGLNLISGENEAGKTGLLEAIYCLGRVRSFRTHVSAEPIRDRQSSFRLVGRVVSSEGRQIPIGIERQRSDLEVHLDGQPIRRLSDLAGSFPVQVMSGDTSTILRGGPRYRRQTLDWALFHVEQSYREVWQRYTRALRQRNAALRAHMPVKQITTWDAELLDAALQLDAFRRSYLEMLEPHLQSAMKQLLADQTLILRYQPGWPVTVSLPEALSQSLEKDLGQGFTQCGPHRSDFTLLVNGQGVASHCSRGQQKVLIVSFMLAQVQLQQEMSVAMGAFLLDDLTSELDRRHQGRVLSALHDLNSQVFVSTIDADAVDTAGWQDAKKFHVEHGDVQEVV
ncbi:MAG: DNA replication/repair protein RecF [Gammaproteobacteria bacterium]|nr:DNA replication/repair protein RecF [Gammaproteobacteria bacterium]